MKNKTQDRIVDAIEMVAMAIVLILLKIYWGD